MVHQLLIRGNQRTWMQTAQSFSPEYGAVGNLAVAGVVKIKELHPEVFLYSQYKLFLFNR